MTEIKHTVMYMAPALLERLGKLAEHYGISRQQVLEIILREELSNDEQA